MNSGQSLLGANVIVDPPEGADWKQFEGTVRAVYVGHERMRFVVKSNDSDRIYDAPAYACSLIDPEPAADKDDPSGAMTEIAASAIDYVMQNPAQDEGNQFQADLQVAVAEWLRKDPAEQERSYWLTDMCADGRCDQCQHDSCECSHHTGVENV